MTRLLEEITAAAFTYGSLIDLVALDVCHFCDALLSLHVSDVVGRRPPYLSNKDSHQISPLHFRATCSC